MLNTDRKALAAAATDASRASRYPGPVLTADSSKAEVEAWLQWCDPNGCHTPRLAEIEGIDPYTETEAWDALASMLDT